jgi:hypothetical protein
VVEEGDGSRGDKVMVGSAGWIHGARLAASVDGLDECALEGKELSNPVEARTRVGRSRRGGRPEDDVGVNERLAHRLGVSQYGPWWCPRSILAGPRREHDRQRDDQCPDDDSLPPSNPFSPRCQLHQILRSLYPAEAAIMLLDPLPPPPLPQPRLVLSRLSRESQQRRRRCFDGRTTRLCD